MNPSDDPLACIYKPEVVFLYREVQLALVIGISGPALIVWASSVKLKPASTYLNTAHIQNHQTNP